MYKYYIIFFAYFKTSYKWYLTVCIVTQLALFAQFFKKLLWKVSNICKSRKNVMINPYLLIIQPHEQSYYTVYIYYIYPLPTQSPFCHPQLLWNKSHTCTTFNGLVSIGAGFCSKEKPKQKGKKIQIHNLVSTTLGIIVNPPYLCILHLQIQLTLNQKYLE